MMSAKMAMPGLHKITVFLNKGYDVTISVNDVIKKFLSRGSNYIVDLFMWPKFGNSGISMTEIITTSILWGFDQNHHFFERGGSWFKFNDLGLALGTNLKFYTSMAKELKLKVKKLWGLIPIEVTGEKLVGWGAFCPPPFLNRVKFPNFLFSSKEQKLWTFLHYLRHLSLVFLFVGIPCLLITS